jgi:hypothetical protein
MSLRDRRLALLPALGLAVLTAACGGSGDGDGGGRTAAEAIPVAATDDACDVEARELEAGTHEFEVTNGGSTPAAGRTAGGRVRDRLQAGDGRRGHPEPAHGHR